MTNDELISKYNPANAANLTAEDLEGMRALTDDQLGVLAKAFPNEPSRKPYLLLYDNRVKPEKQIWPPSTWQNLYNVRKFANQKNLLPYTFRSLHNEAKLPATVRAARQQTGATSTSAKKVVVDLTAQQAKAELEKHLGGKETGAMKTERVTAPTATSAKKTAKPATTKKTAAAATGAATAQAQESPADQTFDSGETE
jgi:hypothetical protein